MEINSSWVVQTLIMVGIGSIAYFLKEFKKSVDQNAKDTSESIKQNQEDLKELKKEFNQHKEKVAKDYVHKDDFIRAMSNVDKKLDKIHDLLLVRGSDR